MAPNVLTDSNISTAYIVHPKDFLERYSAALGSHGAGLRELGRIGFLVPAHAVYLMFGAVPEFFIMRYAFALIAVVPTYVLLRRIYGAPAGVIGIIVVMSSPVIVTAWGTDYPDSAVVSYLIGSLACLALSLVSSRQRVWLVLAGATATMALWSHQISVPLLAVMFLSYLGVRIAANRERIGRDVLLLGGVALTVTAVLALGSQLMFGRSDFLSLSWKAYRFYSQPVQVNFWHTSYTVWLSKMPYLLVPPAVIGAWCVTFFRLQRPIPRPQLLIGTVCALQVGVFSYMQFFGKSWTLEQHYLSSTLFGAVALTLAVTLSELAAGFQPHRIGRWIPPLLVLAVPLVYAAGVHASSFTWIPVGVLIASLIVASALLVRLFRTSKSRSIALGVAAFAIGAISGGTLTLMTTPLPGGSFFPGTGGKDPIPAYSTALGGSGARELAKYRVATQLPVFVGNASYPGEQLMMWITPDTSLSELTGMYHGGVNLLYPVPGPPDLNAWGAALIEARRPAELLVLSRTPLDFAQSISALQRYDPELVRQHVFDSDGFVVYAWLVKLKAFARTGSRP